MVGVPFVTFAIFSHNVAIRAWKKYLWYSAHEEQYIYLQLGEATCSIKTLPRFDAFITTTIFCIRNNESDLVGGHRQKLYPDTFAAYDLLVTNPLIGRIRVLVHKLCPTQLCSATISLTIWQQPQPALRC